MRHLYLSLVVLSLIACKDVVCDAENEQNGIIEEIITSSCYPCKQDGVIISTQEEFQSYADDCNPGGNCSLPTIDFTSKTVLGMHAQGGGCDIGFARSVVRDDENQQYIYTVKVKACGNCEMLGLSDNLVVVPKLPDGWTVAFRREP